MKLFSNSAPIICKKGESASPYFIPLPDLKKSHTFPINIDGVPIFIHRPPYHINPLEQANYFGRVDMLTLSKLSLRKRY